MFYYYNFFAFFFPVQFEKNRLKKVRREILKDIEEKREKTEKAHQKIKELKRLEEQCRIERKQLYEKIITFEESVIFLTGRL
jgi:cell shape-determining protein MreC